MKTSETLLLLDIWRTAYRTPGGLQLNFSTKRAAVRARMQLYTAARPYKRGDVAHDDLELAKAAEELEIVWVGETGIHLQKREDSEMMQVLQSATGKKLQEYVDPDVAAMEARLLKELGINQPSAPLDAQPAKVPELPPTEFQHRENPFYSKRG